MAAAVLVFCFLNIWCVLQRACRQTQPNAPDSVPCAPLPLPLCRLTRVGSRGRVAEGAEPAAGDASETGGLVGEALDAYQARLTAGGDSTDVVGRAQRELSAAEQRERAEQQQQQQRGSRSSNSSAAPAAAAGAPLPPPREPWLGWLARFGLRS